MFALFSPRICDAFTITTEEATIGLVSPKDGRNWVVKKYGDKVVALVTAEPGGDSLFHENGDAKDFEIKLKVTPFQGYELTSPDADGAGIVSCDFKNGTSRITTLKFKYDEENSDVEIHVIPAILHTISFGNTVGDLQSDDGTLTYSAPHWKDWDFDGVVNPGCVPTADQEETDRNYPVAFVRHTASEISVVVKLGAVPPEEAKLCLDAASDPGGVTIVMKDLVRAVDSTFVVNPAESSQPFDDIIDYFDSGGSGVEPFKINWQIGLGGELIPLQETRHTLYLLKDQPIMGTYGLRESMLYYACRGGAGAVPGNDTDLAARIHNTIFGPAEMYKVVEARAVEDKGPGKDPLKYAAPGSGPDYIPHIGRGMCGGWANLMVDVVKLHGVQNIARVRFQILGEPKVDGISPSFWYVHNREPFPTTPSEVTASNPVPASLGIVSQGSGSTIPTWPGHAVVGWQDGTNAIGPYYDPSNGGPVFTDVDDYKVRGVAGFNGEKVPLIGPTSRYVWMETETSTEKVVFLERLAPPYISQ